MTLGDYQEMVRISQERYKEALKRKWSEMNFPDIWAQSLDKIWGGDSGDETKPSIEEVYPIPLIAEPKPETTEEINARAWKAIEDLSRG